MKRAIAFFLMSLVAVAQATTLREVHITDRDNDTNAVTVNAKGELQAALRSTVDTNNTTAIPLGANISFTGDGTEVLDYSMLMVTVLSDQDSATNGFVLQASPDNVTWFDGIKFNVKANKAKTFTFPTATRYMRISYTNGPSAQSFFYLYTVLRNGYSLDSTHRLLDALDDDDDARLVKAVISGQDENDVFRNARLTLDGYLSVSDRSAPSEIAFGKVTGKNIIQKFGNAPDFDTGDGYVTIWDGANDGGIDAMMYTYSTTDDIDSIISSSAADTEPIEIQGLDGDGNLVVVTNTLTGQTRVALSTNFHRVFRMKNIGASDIVGDVSCYANNAATTAGVVDDPTEVRALILGDYNQTQMSIFTVPAGKEIVIKNAEWISAGAKKEAAYEISLWARSEGGVFRLQYRAAINDTTEPAWNKPYQTGLYYDEMTDIETRCRILTTGTAEATISSGFEIEMNTKNNGN